LTGPRNRETVVLVRRRTAGSFETLGGNTEKIGRGGEIPIARGRINVPQIGGEKRHPGRHVDVGAVPPEQRFDGERVAEVVSPRMSRRRCRLQPSEPQYRVERRVERLVAEPRASDGDEHAARIAGRADPVPELEIAGELVVLGCSRTSRDFPNFESRITSSCCVQSMSVRSSLNASPIRMPVHASRPISVSEVAARSRGRSRRAACISAAISSSL
jgi:hypothetical protein